jgi:ribonuclease HI
VTDLKQVTIHTDGACLGNPGPGGYGVVIRYEGHKRELFGGFRLTTNNRMEVLAAIVGLQTLKERCHVSLVSDSQYLVSAMTRSWARRWRSNGWRRGTGGRAANADLWERLLNLCDQHDVEFRWVRGHAGDPDNERCDVLANQAARQPVLPPDRGYDGTASDTAD